VYNRPSSLIFSDASQLLQLFKAKLDELVKKGVITAEDAAIPDYGPLPEFEDSPPPEEDDEDEDDEEEEEEEEEESDADSDDEGGRRRGRRSGRQSGRRDRGGDDDDPHSKRGRPPKVLTPLEARISAIIRGLRRYKNREGQVGVSYFEKTPDKMDLQGNIAEAISLDTIKKKLKRKKYQNVDQMVRDMDVVFENVKASNKPGDLLHEDAIELQKLGHELAEEQKARPDDDFRDEDGLLPLASITHNGREWKVGKCSAISAP
jgi:chromatin structure-remodeling complex subunit RSC1/2